jgi:hypothetical protein
MSITLSLHYEPVPHLEAIFPTALCLIVGDKDFLASPDLTAAVYAGAMEPKSLTILKGGHFDGFQGEGFKIASTTALRWFEKYLKQESESSTYDSAIAPGQRFTTLISTALKHQLYLSKRRKEQSHVTITLVV